MGPEEPGHRCGDISRPTCASSPRVGSAPHVIAIQDHHRSRPHTSGGASILLRSETRVATRMMLGPRCAPTGSPLQTPTPDIPPRDFPARLVLGPGEQLYKCGLTHGAAGELLFCSIAQMRNALHLTLRKKEGKCFP